ncbi:hypothetical protein [Roseateles sp. P5_E7]
MTRKTTPAPRRQLLLGLLALAGVVHGAPPPPKPSLVKRLLRITGLSLAPGQLKGPGDATGSIWVAALSGNEAPQRWSRRGGLRSPVFDAEGRSLYALRGDDLVRLDAPGREPVRLALLERAQKLVGVSDGELIFLRSDARQPLAAWPLGGGAVQLLELDLTADETLRMLGQMRGESRGTAGFVIGPRQQSREGKSGMLEWLDIMLLPRDGSPPRNLSRSGGTDCAQPALDPRAERVAYVLVDEA